MILNYLIAFNICIICKETFFFNLEFQIDYLIIIKVALFIFIQI